MQKYLVRKIKCLFLNANIFEEKLFKFCNEKYIFTMTNTELIKKFSTKRKWTIDISDVVNEIKNSFIALFDRMIWKKILENQVGKMLIALVSKYPMLKTWGDPTQNSKMNNFLSIMGGPLLDQILEWSMSNFWKNMKEEFCVSNWFSNFQNCKFLWWNKNTEKS